MALNFANNNSLSAIDTKPSGLSGGSMNLISTQTASNSANISFTSGIDSTYDSYVFKFYDIHAGTDNTDFMFNASIDSGSNYNVVKTTTTFQAYHNEAGNDQALNYDTSDDLAQSTAFQQLLKNIGSDNDQSGAGTLTIFNPSSDTFVKHFIATGNSYNHNDYVTNTFTAGYFNTQSVINAIQFSMSSGNFDGVIKLYGVS
jgi:hypothetical protein